MNAAPVFLILFLLSTSYGGKEDDSPAIGVANPTKAQKVESSPKVSCPEPTDIAPCVCSTSDSLVMDCSDVQDEDQLRMAFSAFFPTTTFDRFYMSSNNGLKVLEDGVFGGVSFEELYISKSALETVRNNSLTSSLSTLETITIEDCQLGEFPFEELGSFTALKTLNLISNKFFSLPTLYSSTLFILDLSDNPISHLSPDVFKNLNDVREISLAGASLTEIPPGTFESIGNLCKLTLSGNDISYLRSKTVRFPYSSQPIELFLDNNSIDYVEEDAIYSSKIMQSIDMSDNTITRLDERVWKTILQNSYEVILTGNPLQCGCDVDWIVGHYSYDDKIKNGNCPNGMPLSDLDREDFEICS